MVNRLKAGFAALAVSLLAIVGFVASPAQANTVFGCPDNNVCIYDGTNYGQGHWTRDSFEYFLNNANGCANVQAMLIPVGGGDMNNATSSIIVNQQGKEGSTMVVSFFPNAYCTGTPIPYHQVGSGDAYDSDLRDGGYAYSGNWSNTLTSIQVRVN